MKKILSIILTSCALASCVDTVILPDNKTVEEDYWQKKSEVQQMVNGAYADMASAAVQQRLIVWASRSDEYVVNSALSNSTLNQIYTANIQTNNSYSDWAAFYSVINRCNLVIAKSAGVMDVDPNYMEGDHNTNVAQMKALRSLCYFYLVRTFRDVPLVLEPYTENSQEMNVPQAAPSVVIDQIISDLEEVKNNALSSQATSDVERVGYFTKDGILALLADVYLWKASVNHDLQSYSKCVECCDQIRRNRSSLSGAGQGMGPGRGNSFVDFDDDDYCLTKNTNYYNMFQGTQNAQENLFSLQFTDNSALCNMYYMYKKLNSANPYFYASDVYGLQKSNNSNAVFPDTKDLRAFESVYAFDNTTDTRLIRKYVAQEGRNGNASIDNIAARNYSPYDENWVVYRTTDVMLMKAEALAQMAKLTLEDNAQLLDQLKSATSLSDSVQIAQQLQSVNEKVADYSVKAARMAQIVNQRARTDEKAQSDIDSTAYSLSASTAEGTRYVTAQATYFNSQLNPTNARNLELIVLAERARELCYEGKRWFDLLRYNYRHMDGVRYDVPLYQQGENLPKNYSGMLDLMSLKYTGSTGASVAARMTTEGYLYMPILRTQIKVNPMLHQNPVYTDTGDSERN